MSRRCALKCARRASRRNIPSRETPTPMPGVQYVQAVYTGHGDYDKVNHPYIDFQKQIVQGGEKIGVWVRDDHTYVTILRSAKGVAHAAADQAGAISTKTSPNSG